MKDCDCSKLHKQHVPPFALNGCEPARTLSIENHEVQKPCLENWEVVLWAASSLHYHRRAKDSQERLPLSLSLFFFLSLSLFFFVLSLSLSLSFSLSFFFFIFLFLFQCLSLSHFSNRFRQTHAIQRETESDGISVSKVPPPPVLLWVGSSLVCWMPHKQLKAMTDNCQVTRLKVTWFSKKGHLSQTHPFCRALALHLSPATSQPLRDWNSESRC